MSFYAYTYRPYVFQNLYLIHWFNYFFHTKIIQHLYIGLQKYSHNLYIYTYTIHDILKLDAIYIFFFEKKAIYIILRLKMLSTPFATVYLYCKQLQIQPSYMAAQPRSTYYTLLSVLFSEHFIM